MQRPPIGWTLTAVTACALSLSAILTGCKGTYNSGGPTGATPTTRRTPGTTPGVTPGSTPGTGSTPGATPGSTPGTLPTIRPTTIGSGTPVPTVAAPDYAGSYTGTFNLSSVEQGSSTLTLTINADGGVVGTVTLNQGGTLTLNGTLSTGDATSVNINLSGQMTSIISSNLVTINLTGRLSVAGGSFISGGGVDSDTESRNGTWTARKTG